MPTKDAYLIRDGRGHMRTVVAFSSRGAVRNYLEQYPAQAGEELEVKRRLSGDWETFRVS
jgi:hypothetical protein